jgi:hypothetical protein
MMGYFQYRRRQSLGGGFYGSMTNAGPRLGYRRGRATVSVGRTGLYAAVRLLRGLSYIIRKP